MSFDVDSGLFVENVWKLELFVLFRWEFGEKLKAEWGRLNGFVFVKDNARKRQQKKCLP